MPKSKKTKQSKMTLEKLALMMGKGFNEVHEKIDNVRIELKTEINKIDEKFDKAIGKQDEILKRVEDMKPIIKWICYFAGELKKI